MRCLLDGRDRNGSRDTMSLERNRVLQEVIRRHANTKLNCPDVACRIQGGVLTLKRGRANWFWGCTRWPFCRQSCAADQRTGDPDLSLRSQNRSRRSSFQAQYETQVTNRLNPKSFLEELRSVSKKQLWSSDTTQKKRRIILEE